jgi:6-phosphogluconolactonase
MHAYVRLNPVIAALTLVLTAACSDRSSSPTSPDGLATSAAQASPHDGHGGGGVYTMTNAPSANAVLAFRRAADGSLSSLGAFATGGRGIGGTVDPLQSQYAVLLDEEHEFLFVVNAGSDDVSAFRVGGDATLTLADRASSGGDRPVSLAAHGQLLYVLNAGDNTLSGLRVNPTGQLIPIPHSTRPLAAGAAGASTIHFTPDGHWLIVTERDANRMETFAVGANGRLGDPVVTPSNGAVPFGFDVTPHGFPVISEAMGAPPNGAVSSYRIGVGGTLSVITPSLDAGGQATCWLILTADGRFAFASNTASDAIAALQVAGNGVVTLVNGHAGLTGAGSAPLDLDLASGDRYVYVLEGGSGNIATFDVGGTGTLSGRADTPAGPPASGLQGMAAW